MRQKGPRIDLLRGLEVFRSLTDKQLGRLAPILKECTARAGETLMREGFVGQECFVVLEGHASVLVGGKHVATIGPGEFVGEMALLANQPRSASVLAEESMRLLVAGPAEFSLVLAPSHIPKRVGVKLSERVRVIEGSAEHRHLSRSASRCSHP